MDGAVIGVIVAALGGAALALLGVGLVTLLRRRNRAHAGLEAMLDAALREADDLRARLEELSARNPDHPAAVAVEPTAFLITDAGRDPRDLAADDTTGPPIEVPDRLVLSATLGVPLVKVASFGHGVRRALAPASRNRIWFEMRSEVRSARKRRRRLVKQHQRDLRADERAQERLA